MLGSVLISVALFAGLLIGLECGRFIGRRLKADKDQLGTGAADGVVLAVFGLIVAFTFSASASRFDERRRLILQQANALGTANLRLDALDAEDRTEIRQRMLQWVQLSLRLSELADDPARLDAAVAEADQLQTDTWRLAAAALDKKQQPALWSFVMPPLNDWIDLSSTRLAMNHLGTPTIVMVTVVGLALVVSLLAGFHMSRHPQRSLTHYVTFASIVALLIYVMLDMNHARAGLIRVDSMDRTMQQVEQTLKGYLK